MYQWGIDHRKFNIFGKKHFNKVPYVVRRDNKNCVGLFALINRAVGGFVYAEKNNYVPVVDMKNYPNMYLDDNQVGYINSWEYYLEQPCELSLDDALSSRKYILGRSSQFHKENPEAEIRDILYAEDFMKPENHEIIQYWRRAYKKFLKFKPEVITKLESMIAEHKGKRILGILVRGTDYAYQKPGNHRIPPTAEQAIAKAQEVMKEKKFDALYLATEDKRIAEKFNEAFGKKLITIECEYIDYNYEKADPLWHYTSERDNDRYIRGLDYVVSMLFLSRCPGFITSITSGSIGVICLSEGFDYLYVFDLGVYP